MVFPGQFIIISPLSLFACQHNDGVASAFRASQRHFRDGFSYFGSEP